MFDQPCLFIEGSIKMNGNKRMNYKVKLTFLRRKKGEIESCQAEK